jgi:sugar O-acyltransferase (sialic acid O-acetyltransferase NeuD family)
MKPHTYRQLRCAEHGGDHVRACCTAFQTFVARFVHTAQLQAAQRSPALLVTSENPNGRLDLLGCSFAESMGRAALFCCAGGHAAVVLDALTLPADTLKVVWDSGARIHPSFASFLHVRTAQDAVLALSAAADGISCYINTGSPTIRAAFLNNVAEAFADLDIDYPVVMHSTAFVSSSASIAEGTFLGPGAVVHTSAQIGRFCIVNTQASVDHDCVLEDFATVNPHAAICGSVHISRGCIIGANASVRERTTLAAGITLGMNACATRDLVSAGVYIGTPARKVPQSRQLAGDDHIPHTVQQQSTDAAKSSAIRWCPKKELNMQRFSRYLQPSLDKGHLTNNGPLQTVLSSKLKQLLDCNSNVIPAASGKSHHTHIYHNHVPNYVLMLTIDTGMCCVVQ